MRNCPVAIACAALCLVATGCAPTFTDRAANGIVFYCPGAGNIDFGDAGIRDGLEGAGFKGQVATIGWTVSFNPAIDQLLRVNARLAGTTLAETIQAYSKKFPGKPIDLVGLSAGSGVAIWSLEDLKPGVMVDHVILLSSSLSYDYDVTKALTHVRDKIYVYYSSQDVILAGPMKIFGTIDAKIGVDGVGAVGLQNPRNKDRIVNIPWRPAFQNYGYYGGHVDSTAAGFVKAVLSKHLLTPAPAKPPEKIAATPPGQSPAAAQSAESPQPQAR